MDTVKKDLLGKDATALRTVTPDMKAKNQPTKSGKVPAGGQHQFIHSISGVATAKPKGPPYCEKVGEVWKVANYVDQKDPVLVSEATMKQAVHITDCFNTTIKIDPKINSLFINGCQKTNVVLANLVAGIEITDSEKVKVQVTGRVPSIAIDKSTGVDLYLSNESKEVEISSSKSGEMNVNFPNKDDPEDWVEVAIPEQYQHKLVSDKITTRVSDLYSC